MVERERRGISKRRPMEAASGYGRLLIIFLSLANRSARRSR